MYRVLLKATCHGDADPGTCELTLLLLLWVLCLVLVPAVVTVFYDPRQVTGGAALHGTDLLLSPVYRDWVRFAVSRPNNVTMDTTYAAHVKVGGAWRRKRMCGKMEV